jgi:hypothetical protein
LGGAPAEEQALKAYLRERMWAVIRRRSVTADVLAEVLIERSWRFMTKKDEH